ncbi:MAG TPA: hypothetical protein VEK08_02170 [Planctomycetota bacterium]|nr:hypothetical protein [Planctomycetota bacterium]
MSAGINAAFQWTPVGRLIVFTLAASSIWCLLAEFYGLCSMQTFTLYVSIPALTLLGLIGILDARLGDGRLWRMLVLSGIVGFAAAIAYDLFRIPFVFSSELGISDTVPHLPLFKVFPRFGAMILGEPVEQTSYSLASQVIGWTYHFSNGVTFGMMYAAMIGDGTKRHWGWAVVMAVGLELAMLLTPYPTFFGIKVAATFVVVTLAAHMIFGVSMGLLFRKLSVRLGPRLQLAK